MNSRVGLKRNCEVIRTSLVLSWLSSSPLFAIQHSIATFRLLYENDYEYEFPYTEIRLAKWFSMYARSELKTSTHSRPCTTIWRYYIIDTASWFNTTLSQWEIIATVGFKKYKPAGYIRYNLTQLTIFKLSGKTPWQPQKLIIQVRSR